MIFFISDLHLSPDRPSVTGAFYKFLATTAADAKELYILGDFFDYWVGDDDDTLMYRQVEKALHAYSRQGTDVYFMQGNRDFLIGNDFAQRSGCTLLQDPTAITLNGRPTVLLHGDSLCTRDDEYMGFRTMVRSPQWQQDLLSKPLAERKALAQHLRETSQSMNSLKAEDIMDVTPSEVEKVLTDYAASLMIHGHTHRPARHPLTINGATAERIVLGDWHDSGWYLVADESSLELKSFSI